METTTETDNLEKLARIMETAAIYIENVAKSIDYVAGNIDSKELFPTIKSIRDELTDSMKDIKSALAQLENVDAELSRMQ